MYLHAVLIEHFCLEFFVRRKIPDRYIASFHSIFQSHALHCDINAIPRSKDIHYLTFFNQGDLGKEIPFDWSVRFYAGG